MGDQAKEVILDTATAKPEEASSAENIDEEIQKIMACGVDDEGLENIFYNNAAKFMGLK